ncbi:MAG: hypothetical protein ACF8PN_11415 [Phycisphaerales bacterium]
MNWLFVGLATYVFLAFDVGLKDLFEIGHSGVQPSFLLIFMVFVASLATTSHALWTSLLVGLVIDLAGASYRGDTAAITLLGPHALGFTLGAAVVLQLRTLVYRRHPLTMAFLTFFAGLIAHLLATLLISIRWLLASRLAWFEPFAWDPSGEIVVRFFSVMYSAVIAIPVGWSLMLTAPLFGLSSHGRLGELR